MLLKVKSGSHVWPFDAGSSIILKCLNETLEVWREEEEQDFNICLMKHRNS